MQKHEVTFQWFKLKSAFLKEYTGLYIGNMLVGEYYLRDHDQKWVVICNDKKIGEFTRPLISRSEAATICLTAAKKLLKIQD